MEECSILLNGGHQHEVATLPDAYPLLLRALGGEPELRTVLELRSLHDDEGRERVAVCVGTEKVGYLPVDIDTGLLATVKACELNEAVARAQGSLLVSWDEPGKVTMKVDLADSDRLLSDSEAEPKDDRGGQDPVPTAAPAAPDNTGAPTLSAGYTEDYPEWPPRKPKPVVTDRPPLTEQQPLASQPATGDEPLPPPDQAIDSNAMSGAQSAGAKVPPGAPVDKPLFGQASSPSKDALLATRSAWTGALAGQSEASQADWLGSKASPAARSSAPSAQSPLLGTASKVAPTSTAPKSQDSLPKSQTDTGSAGSCDLDSEIVAAWMSSGPCVQSTPQPPDATKPRINTNWVIPTVVAVLAIAIGLLVWKFVFAPKTYTDSEYGYSFSYPGRWEILADSSMLSQFAYMLEGQEMPSMVLIGDGLDSNGADEVAMLAVARGEATGYVDESQIATQLRSQFDEAELSGLGFSMIEPVYPTTVGGLDGWKMTMSVGIGFYSMTMSYCLLLDGDTVYVLMAAATGEAWNDNHKAFDRFFDSFEPG